jgi:hypothetical protein
MNSIGQTVWTYELNNNSITIDRNFGLTIISFTLISGVGFYQGASLANGIASSPVNLVVGQAVTICSDSNNPLDQFLISTSGVIAIIGKQ